jgi:hypothetical protein
MDDLIAVTGLICLLAGLYVWLGLAAPLIVGGLVLIWIGYRYEDTRGANQATDTHPNQIHAGR